MSKKRWVYYLSASMFIGFPGAVFAQNTPATVAGAMVDDIVVTAQRREERGQDVPISLSVFSESKLRQLNINQPQDLYGSSPSLVVGPQGSASRDAQSFAIRGQATGYLSSPAVAMYLNEVPLPQSVVLGSQGAPGLFFDLENVQVLNGPQGTLFGRNTTGGAVLFQARRPDNVFGGYVEGSLGNLDLHGVEGALNIPLVKDKLLVRISGAWQERRGYTRDIVWNKWRDNTSWVSGRIGILFRPDDRVENYLMVYGTRSSNNGAGYVHRGWNVAGLEAVGFCSTPPTPPVPGLGVPCDVYQTQTEIADALGPRKVRDDLDAFSRAKAWGVINTTSIDLSEGIVLRNIFSYQKLKNDYAVDQDGTPLQHYEFAQTGRYPDFPVEGLTDRFGLPVAGYLNGTSSSAPRDSTRQITEEIQLQGNFLDDQLAVTAGGFYFDARPDQLWGSQAIFACPAAFTGLCAPQTTLSGLTNTSKALYMQGTLDLGVFSDSLKNLRLTAGYRYTWDSIQGFSSSFTPMAGAPGMAQCTQVQNPDAAPSDLVVPLERVDDACRFDGKLKSSSPTWTFGIDYKPVPSLMLYAKASRGYKAGGFNITSVRPETRTFLPERLTSYEFGFKSSWFEDRVPTRLNATYFHSNYSNILRPAGDYNAATNVLGTQAAAASARINGFEAELAVQPARFLQINATLSHTNAKYKTFDYTVPLSVPLFPACNGLIPAGGTADLSCRPFQFVTDWIYNISGTVALPVPEKFGSISLYASYSHVGNQPVAPFADNVLEPGSRLEPYGLFNMSLIWENIGETGIDLTLFTRNLFNKTYRVGNSNLFQDLWINSTLYGEPRTFGLKLRYNFGG